MQVCSVWNQDGRIFWTWLGTALFCWYSDGFVGVLWAYPLRGSRDPWWHVFKAQKTGQLLFSGTCIFVGLFWLLEFSGEKNELELFGPWFYSEHPRTPCLPPQTHPTAAQSVVSLAAGPSPKFCFQKYMAKSFMSKTAFSPQTTLYK